MIHNEGYPGAALPEELTQPDHLIEAIRPLADRYADDFEGLVDQPRSVYELYGQVYERFGAHGFWNGEDVCTIIAHAKEAGVVSEEADSRYGWWLREAWEQKRDMPILEAVRAVCGSEIEFNGRDVGTVLRDMQVLWGITAGATFHEMDEQAAREAAWNRDNPDDIPMVTPVLQCGSNAFFDQNTGIPW